LVLGAFVTALYIFRAFFMAFHGKERMGEELRKQLHEPWTSMMIPVVILAVVSVVIGAALAGPMLYETPGLFGHSIFTLSQHQVLAPLAAHYHGALDAIAEAFVSIPFWAAVFGIVAAWLGYIKFPQMPKVLAQRFSLLYKILVHKYGFDALNHLVFERGGIALSTFFYKVTDVKLVDDYMVNGSGRGITLLSEKLKRLQTGYLYHYAFAMILGLCVFLIWLLFE